MIKIGVTGSNGFIGWHLCQFLKLNRDKFELIEFKRDWFNESTNLDLFVTKCNVIVHLAGLNRYYNEDVIYNTNVELTDKLLKSFNRTVFTGQVIFSSSKQEERNNKFGNSKKFSRELFTNWAEVNDTKFTGLIIPNVFGAFGVPFYNSVISTFCHQLVNNATPYIDNDATLDLIYIDDLVKQIIDLFETETNKYLKIDHSHTCSVSEILELLLKFKVKYFEKGQIPKFANSFEINLFNTFRSYFDLSTQFPIKFKNNIDDRGNFVEIIRSEAGGQVSFSTTKTGITRGNHFHTRKIERFSVIKGKALIQLRKIDTAEVFYFYLSGDEPAFVDMPIWYIHNIINIGSEDLYTIFWINEPYDSNDPDTYLENI
jgi:UDP-2-acetamido-2,6-beta-L-arabino-hexul-4-ose reductase